MNIQQLQYVLAIVDYKNFELAAEKCFITQSTLSTMVGRFEDEIGIKIFNRTTKPVSITSEGEIIIERLRIILHEIEELNNLFQELKGEMVGEITIGVIPTIAPYLLPLMLDDYAQRFPKVKITVKEMTTAQIEESLRNRSLDIGILAIPLNNKKLDEIELYNEPFYIYDCTGKRKLKKTSIQSLDYSKICLLQEGHCLRTQVNKICELSAIFNEENNNYQFESGSMDSLLRITKSRNGITIVPHLTAISLSEEDRKRITEFQAPVPVRKVGIVTNKYFVKKKLLEGLKEAILKSVDKILKNNENQLLMHPN